MAEDVLTFEELRRAQSRERDTDTLQELDDAFLDRARSYLDLKRDGDSHLQNQEYRNARNILQDIVDRRQKKIVKLAFLAVKSNVNVDNLMAHEEELFTDLTDVIGDHRFDVESDLVDGEEAPEPAGDADEGGTDDSEETAEPEADIDDETGDGEDVSDDADADEAPAGGEEDRDDLDPTPGAEPTDDPEPDGTEDPEDADDEEPDDGDDLILGGEPDVPEKDEDATTRDPGVSADGAADAEQDADAAADGEDPDDGDAAPDGMVKVAVTADVPEFMGTDLEPYGPFEEGEEVLVPEQNAEVLADQGKAEPV